MKKVILNMFLITLLVGCTGSNQKVIGKKDKNNPWVYIEKTVSDKKIIDLSLANYFQDQTTRHEIGNRNFGEVDKININIKSEDADKVEESLNDIFSKLFLNQNEADINTLVLVEGLVNNDFASFFVFESVFRLNSDYAYSKIQGYTFDLSTGNLLSVSEIMEQFNLSNEEFYSRVESAASVSKKYNGIVFSNDKLACKKQSEEDELCLSISDVNSLFITTNYEMGVIVNITFLDEVVMNPNYVGYDLLVLEE